MSKPASHASNVASRLARTGLLSALLTATGCAAVMPSKPPPYTGTDQVQAVDRDVFVGDWRLVALNPPEGEEVPERTLSYAADGTFVASIQPTEEMAESTGDAPIGMSGSWSVEDGRLVQQTEEISVPGADGLVNDLMAAMIRRSNPLAAAAEIYEADPRRIVIVSDDGYANALERL